jgi:hypothetical protein
MFPDLSRLATNTRMSGKVFSARVNSAGIGVQSTEIAVDESAWEQCTVCPDYTTCRDLSTAKLILERALNRN